MRQKASDTDADLDEQILLLAVPALLSLLLDPLLTAADTAFVGKSEETVTTEANQSVFMKEKGENRMHKLSRTMKVDNKIIMLQV